ncbi:hydrolase 1, exosortase A system-associated [Sphingomonas sp. BGYR3]|uniref:hydrolase 1, exosortase A system-associated n=1 Tax=Sphingomonas sp. BGYR3 TaxID=2975483 RepID=UPI0021A5A49E|nr:hydrolase 1, exosortase A system-associated [Sphingomonas sp. BGYR3]MDG5487588.1 hydrolase 1, exosortase A system-associated [Sphingomonas sp. BGYR3]
MRRLISFSCAGETLAGTVDAADGTTGLLIVSGGNEVRWGAHRGMAMLAGELAAAGHPVFRFDRRGIGDSTGTNGGFQASGEDIEAAAAAFRRECPHVTRIIGFGNCDAATALALFHARAGLDALILANPWVIPGDGDLPPPAAVKARYVERMRDPRQLVRLIRGEISLTKLFNGLGSLLRTRNKDHALADRVAAALIAGRKPLTLLLARGDNTAIAFAEAWRDPAFAPLRGEASVLTCDTASHSFAEPADKLWLRDRLLDALRG